LLGAEDLAVSTWILLNVIGHDATLRLQRAVGGGYIPLRLNPPDNDPLVQELGREEAERVIAYLRSVPECHQGRLYVGRGLVRRERNVAILADRRSGMTIVALAAAHGMTQEAIRKVLATYADELYEE
jgi:hypothetical protein